MSRTSRVIRSVAIDIRDTASRRLGVTLSFFLAWSPSLELVVQRRGDRQHRADRLDPELLPVLVDEPDPARARLDSVRGGHRQGRRRFGREAEATVRMRDTGAGLLTQTLGRFEPVDAGEATHEDQAVRVRAWLDSPTYAFFQRLHVNVEVSVAPGLHVYGVPAPAGFLPLSVEVSPIAGVEVGAAEWPAPHPFKGEGPASRSPNVGKRTPLRPLAALL